MEKTYTEKEVRQLIAAQNSVDRHHPKRESKVLLVDRVEFIDPLGVKIYFQNGEEPAEGHGSFAVWIRNGGEL